MVNSPWLFRLHELIMTDIEAAKKLYARVLAGARDTFYCWKFVSGLMGLSLIRLLAS